MTVSEIQQFGKNYALVTAWERERSTVIPKDYNHYITFDILM